MLNRLELIEGDMEGCLDLAEGEEAEHHMDMRQADRDYNQKVVVAVALAQLDENSAHKLGTVVVASRDNRR